MNMRASFVPDGYQSQYRSSLKKTLEGSYWRRASSIFLTIGLGSFGCQER